MTLCTIALAIALSDSKTTHNPDKTLNPAFLKSAEQIKSAWEAGEKAAPRDRNPQSAWGKSAKGIGKIRTGVIGEATVSWAYFLSPELLAYTNGFFARKKYWDDKERSRALDSLLSVAATVPKRMAIRITLSLQPSFGKGGKITRRANPDDLRDVRCVVQVGDKIIQPQEKPGDLTAATSELKNDFESPESANTRTSVYVNGAYTGSVSTSSTYIVQRTENYEVYNAAFTSYFPLFDVDGTPRITDKDKEFTVIVVYGSNERKATFPLTLVANPLK